MKKNRLFKHLPNCWRNVIPLQRFRSSQVLKTKCTNLTKDQNWDKNSRFIQKFTFWKSNFFFTKFTFSKTHFWQNSHFQILIYDKIHIFKDSFFTKFTFFKYEIWINSSICGLQKIRFLFWSFIYSHYWQQQWQGHVCTWCLVENAIS